MARIELKNCLIYIRDGFTGAAAVNNVSNYAIGATTMIIDGYTGLIPDGVLFQVTGSDRLHRITSSSDTAGDTTSITFTPGLGGAVLDNAVITLQGRSISIKSGDGNLSWSETENYEYDLDRGLLDTVRKGDEEPMQVSLDSVFEFISAVSGSDPTLREALKQTGQASAWTSASSDTCEPYAVDIVVEQKQPCSGIKPELIIFPDFRMESLDFDAQAATISLSGRCNATGPTSSRLSTT